ncbi:hypothetical protein ABT369_47860 [Dactylosporangium sp. NPDC000244]|uniref:hypothetical protein n=1 Tax=Dactylosporangium sp. NPDC000244 TaxID=3154365 RepID=UPI003321FE0D
MRLDEYLARNAVPSADPETPPRTADPAEPVLLAGRLLSSTDAELRVLLGSVVARVPHDAVVDIEPDPAPPTVEPGAAYVRLRVRADQELTLEAVAAARALAGAGLRPMVAAQASLAPLYRVYGDRGNTGGDLSSSFWHTAMRTDPWVARAEPLSYSTRVQTAAECRVPCDVATVGDGGVVSTDHDMCYVADWHWDTTVDTGPPAP